jgi:hypothetical protein
MAGAVNSATPPAGTLRRFRWAITAAVLLALYALAGFVLAPWLIARELPAAVREATGREATLAGVEFNPFTLALRARGFELQDTDGSRLAGVEELFLDLDVSSAWRRALVLAELTIRNPYANVVRARSGAINLLELVPPEPQPAPPPAAGDDELPRLVVRKLRLEGGLLDVTDRVPAEEFRTRVGPFGVALDELSTLPDATGSHDIAITLESGTKLTIAGDLTVNPLAASGEFRLEGPFLGLLHRYMKEEFTFDVSGGATTVAGRFRFAGRPDASLEGAVTGLDARFTGVTLTAPEAPDFLRFDELALGGGSVEWPAGVASVESIALKGMTVRARRERDGRIDVAELLTPRAGADSATPTAAPADAPAAAPGPAAGDAATPPAPPAVPADDGAAFQVRIAQAKVEDLAVDFTDAGPATPGRLAIADLDLVLRDVTNEPGAKFPMELAVAFGAGGTLEATGSVVAQPEVILDADVALEGVQLKQAQPWVSDIARIAILEGALGADGHVVSNPQESFAFEGDARITGLDTRDLVRNEKLLGWRELGVDDVQFFLDGNRARIARVRLVRPFARIYIAEDQSTNIGALLVETAPAAEAAPAQAPAGGEPAAGAAAAAPRAAEQAFRARINRVVVTRGDVDFTDLSLPLPFAARIQDLKGEFTTIDTVSASPSRINLEGRVDPFGLARVDGQVRVSAPTDLADIGVVFRNIEMAPLSPYTVKFAGRKIAGGRINLDLRYQLTDRRMVGANKIVIDELELGEKVPNPDAVDLPLGLAVALLKDANGRIDIDMPVSGSLDDPEFGIGSVVWKAFVNLITKVATAPFRLIGNLLGIESEDLGRIDFSPGRSDLLPPEQEKIGRIAEALAKRPGIVVEIPPVVDPEADATVLRRQAMEGLVEQGLAASGAPASGRGLEKRTRKVVEALFTTAFPAEPLEPIQARFQAPPADDPEGRPRLDELAYLDELRERIASAQDVGADELAALGAARAAAIAAELTGPRQVAPERVRTVEAREAKVRDGQWVPVEIGIDAGADSDS